MDDLIFKKLRRDPWEIVDREFKMLPSNEQQKLVMDVYYDRPGMENFLNPRGWTWNDFYEEYNRRKRSG
jgi:hypothetical protein